MLMAGSLGFEPCGVRTALRIWRSCTTIKVNITYHFFAKKARKRQEEQDMKISKKMQGLVLKTRLVINRRY